MERLDHPTLSGYVSFLERVAELDGDLDATPELGRFDDYADDMRDAAAARGHLDALRIGLADALRSDDDIRRLAATDYAWQEVQLRRIVRHAYERLFPDHPL